MAETDTKTYADKLHEIVFSEEASKQAMAVGGGENKDKSREEHLPERQLPTETIPTKKITWERAKMLAQTRRKRINEFSVGGLIAALPGAIQSIVDYRTEATHPIPSGGHLAEIVFALIFATLTAASLLNFRDPTSADVLEKTFPEMVEQDRFIRRVRRWWKRLNEDFKTPV